MRPFFVLAQKEIRQNAVLFFLPVGVYLLLVAARFFPAVGLPQRYLDLLATALPAALAAAFGLQAFDAEENTQTKDFLLTKPVSSGEIVAAKYLVGLVLILGLFFAGEVFLLPEAVRPPSLADYSTLWLYTYLFLVVIIHMACFAVAAYIKGPRKVLYGLVFILLAAGWFLTGFFGLITIFYYFWGDPGTWAAWMGIGVGAGLAGYLGLFLLHAADWALCGLPLGWIRRRLLAFLIGLVFIPLVFGAILRLGTPAIRPFSSLFATFFSGEEWFTGVTAVKHPVEDRYALADAHGRLAIATKGGRPRVVYSGEESNSADKEGASSPLTSLGWSPDGRWITFVQDGLVKGYDTREKKTVAIIWGDMALWSTNPEKMAVLKKEGTNTYRYSLVDVTRRVGLTLGELDLRGLAVGWEAEKNRLLILGPDGLLVYALENQKTEKYIPLSPPLPRHARVMAGRILAPSRPEDPYRLVFFVLPEDRKETEVYLYNFSPRKEIIEGRSVWRGLKYRDIIFAPGSDKALGYLGMGVYREISPPGGGRS